ncbi:cobalamin-binding protein [Saccharobesus litoralis]|nr:cobalamin-binding protein [Saccharobesus litoralis]
MSVFSVKFQKLWLLALSFMAFSSYADKSEQRYVVLAPHIVEMLFDLGVGQRIVGATAHSDYPEEAKSIPLVGNYARLKIENILAYKPDVIFAWHSGNPSDDLQRLQQLGLNIVYSHTGDLENVAKELIEFGDIVGKPQRAKQIADEYLTQLAALRQKYSAKKPVKVFYELWSRPLTTVANSAWPQHHVTLCGGQNVFTGLIGDYPQIGLEQVVALKPQVIIQPMSDGEPNPDAVNWAQWPKIPAAKNKLIFEVNSDKLHRMTRRVLGEIDNLCSKIDIARQVYN